MKRFSLLPAVLAGTLSLAMPAVADEDDDGGDGGAVFQVTVTNITRGQVFTPILVVSHKAGVRLFTVGQAASPELAVLAESGDVVPLRDALLDTPGVADVAAADDALPPGQSVTLEVDARGRSDRVSLAAMLVPTNDAFVALNAARGPIGRRSATFRVPAYDAGSEANDELCANIPGPPGVCEGEGVSAPADTDEGFVHIHAGIHDIGDLAPEERDWRNPVAEVKIRRVRD